MLHSEQVLISPSRTLSNGRTDYSEKSKYWRLDTPAWIKRVLKE